MSARVRGIRLMSLVALVAALLIIVEQPVQAFAKQRIAIAPVANSRDGLAGDPGDGFGGDSGDGDEGDPGDGDGGDPTDGNGRHAVDGNRSGGIGVAASTGVDLSVQYGWPVAATIFVLRVQSWIRAH